MKGPGFLELALCLGTVLASCGPAGGGSGGGPTPTPTAILPSGGEKATLTEADGNTTLYVRVSAVITVRLAAATGYRWSQPTSSNETAVTRDSAALTPDGGAVATFHTLMPGSAELTATDDPTCRPTCGRPSRSWRVSVVVTPHPVPY